MLFLLLLIMMVPSISVWRHFCRSASEVHVDPTFVRFSGILKTEVLTDLFDSRLDLLDVVCGMVALSDDSGIHEIYRFSSILPQEGERGGRQENSHVQMRLSMRLSVFDPLLENFFRFFNELAVQIDSVRCYAPFGVILAEDVFGGLAVVLLHFATVLFALFG